MDDVIEQLMREVAKQQRENFSLSDDLLSALQFIFGAPLLPALDLIDNEKISMLKSPSGRNVFQVIGSSGNPYICFTNGIYCGCHAFKFNVLVKKEYIMCKHVLAAKIATAMERVQEQLVTNEELTSAIRTID